MTRRNHLQISVIVPTYNRAALIGEALTEAAIEAASTIAAEECSPISDLRGSDWYRRRMVGVLVRRALGSLRESALVAA